MAINKVIYGGNTLIDLSADTITPDKILSGFTAHDKSGESITGTCTKDVNSSDATVAVAEILSGKTAYARGAMLEGTMVNNGSHEATINSKTDNVLIPIGYHDGSGYVSISADEQSKIIESNIKSGIEILGVIGSYSGESVSVQSKTVSPSTVAQTVFPDAGYDYISQVTVEAVSYIETSNAAGGTTVTIAG